MKQAYEFGHIPIFFTPLRIRQSKFLDKMEGFKFLKLSKKFLVGKTISMLKLGHKNLENKVENIIREFDHLGAIQDNNIFSK